VAITSSRRVNPDGRMPLREHLVELRKRVVRAGIGVLLGTIVGWFLYDPLVGELTQPIQRIAAEEGREATINFSQVASSFDLKVKISIWLGIIVASPVWIYQLWAFITPGLTTKERRYALGFLSAAVPLFLAGIWLAWQFIPNAVRFLTGFTPEGGSNIIDAQYYLGFVTRLLLAFGIAFLLPVVLVGLNFAGLMRGRTMLKAWRWVVVLALTFAAMATPTPDVTAMFMLALPMLALFAVAIGMSILNDKRKGRDEPVYADVDDDTASEL